MGEGTPGGSGGFWVEVHGTEDAKGYVLVHESARAWTVSAVATEAGITEGRVGQLLIGGRFPNAFKLGRPWLIPDADVKAYLARPDRRRKDAGEV